jgi:hypothetical protein
MIKHYKLTLAALVLLLSAFASATVASAQLAPNYHRLAAPPNSSKVVFIGDWITYNWTALAANPNWINQGIPGEPIGLSLLQAQTVAANFQADVVNLHPAIVHILIGQGDADGYHSDQGQTDQAPSMVAGLQSILQQARAANIQVILGTEPANFSNYLPMEQFNSIIASFGAANNIPVINYADALCSCVGVFGGSGLGGDTFSQYGGGPYIAQNTVVLPYPDDYGTIITPTGYNLMTQMVETTIAAMTHTLEGGWLQDVVKYNDDRSGSGNCAVSAGSPCLNAVNVNTVETSTPMQFTAVGYYSDGSQHPQLNTNINGASGTWTSSNPLVMFVNQQGLAEGNSAGTAIIRYTSPNGVAFSEWIMYVGDGP